MKHKFLSLFIAIVAMTSLYSPTFASVTINGIAYELNGTTATVVSGGNYTGTIVIPASVTYASVTYSVTSIGDFAFEGCSGLTSVTIPNSVTSIGYDAFLDCWGLTSVTIPNSVTSIGDFAFEACFGLTSVTIPNSVTSIGSYAFLDCGLTSVTIGNSVTSIGNNAFRDCTGLTSVVWNAKNGPSYNFGSQVTSFTFGDEVETIPSSVCSGMTNLTSITIPNSVTRIGSSAFQNCSGLTSVTIPNSVKSIGGSAFSGCTGLTSPVYNTHVFAYMPTSYSGAYTIPDGIESIAGGAFLDCSGLTSVTIGNSVKSIGGSAFSGCTGLASVAIPNSVTSIGWRAFSGCTGLPVIDNIRYADTYLVEAVDKTLSTYTIKEGTKWIGDEAFSGCTGLTSVTIEAETPPTLGSDVFYNTNNCPIYVPCGTLDAYKSAWSEYAFQIKYSPLEYQITGNVNIEGAGSVQLPQNKCEDVISATPNYGYHFVRWRDGNTDNPRTFVLTQDTTFTAEFAKNTYTISTTSTNPERGTTAGDTAALYLDDVEISATANYGYHFVRWNDGNTSNPRTVTVTTNETYTATFAKNVYSITKNAVHGSISGNSSAEYLDFVTLTVVPDYGYHFTQWSDGLKDNPRIAQITQDTTFTAEFAYDRVGTCGKDLALVWSYDPTNKVLTIGNAGSFTENMQFGAEAPNEMEELVIGNNVTAIGANAFAGIETLKKVSIGESVKTIYDRAFYNCVNLETIFNYRPTPTNAYSAAFDGVDKFECKLYVLPSSIDMYKNASVWRDFYYKYAIGAEETTVTTNDVQVEPQDNAAMVTWPTSENAASYTIQITKDGEVFCTLIFNANGQLTGIAFAPSRDGQAHAPQALMTAKGMQFTVTGLNSATHYNYTLQTKDANDNILASYSGEFTTTGVATAIDNIDSSSLQGGDRGRLILHDGQIFILHGDKVYTVTGQEVR